MTDFQFISMPLRLVVGTASLDALARDVSRLEVRRAVVFCGRTMGNSPVLDLLRKALGDKLAHVYTGVRSHSPVPDVIAASHVLRDFDADAVIALGGGSAIVTARAASIVLAEGDQIAALATCRGADGQLVSPRLEAAKLPQLVVPTTPTTAIVKAGSALFDPASGERLALFDPKTRAHGVYVHPDLLATAPLDLYKAAGVNGLTMAIEGLLSRRNNPLADGLLMHALRLGFQGLQAMGDPCGDVESARRDLVLAAILCGQGTDHAGAGMTTVLGHAIGASHHIDNGTVNAVLLSHALRFNAGFADKGFGKIAAALDLPRSAFGAEAPAVEAVVSKLLSTLPMPDKLRDIGVLREALPGIADAAMEDWFLAGNPRKVERAADMLAFLEAAW